jgi:uncharacterized membrane protein
MEMRLLDAGAGATWWAEGWRLFVANIGTWIGVVIIYFILSGALSSVPYIGSFAQWLLTPVFVGGIMVGCQAIDRGESLRIAHLFEGFKEPHFIPLMIVGAVNMGLLLIIAGIAFVAFAGGIGLSTLAGVAAPDFDPMALWRSVGVMTLLGAFLALVVATVMAMINWFAPALIILREAKPLAAMQASFSACMRNWVPFLVYGAIGILIGLIVMVLFVVMVVVFGISAFTGGQGGWGSAILGIIAFVVLCVALGLAMTPVVFGSTYAGYRDMFARADQQRASVGN